MTFNSDLQNRVIFFFMIKPLQLWQFFFFYHFKTFFNLSKHQPLIFSNNLWKQSASNKYNFFFIRPWNFDNFIYNSKTFFNLSRHPPLIFSYNFWDNPHPTNIIFWDSTLQLWEFLFITPSLLWRLLAPKFGGDKDSIRQWTRNYERFYDYEMVLSKNFSRNRLIRQRFICKTELFIVFIRLSYIC